jgi:hypothetical protein
LFSSNGDRIGGEFKANTYMGEHHGVRVTLLLGDVFVVCWESEGQDGGGTGIYG